MSRKLPEHLIHFRVARCLFGATASGKLKAERMRNSHTQDVTLALLVWDRHESQRFDNTGPTVRSDRGNVTPNERGHGGNV